MLRRKTGRIVSGTPGHGRRLRVEPLEDRRLLTVVAVDTLDDTVDSNDGLTSLREAITTTNLASGADTIEFAASLTSGGPAAITLTQGELKITDSLAIIGPGAGLLAIDASGNDPTPDVNNGDGSRVFNIDDGNNANRLDVSISGLTLTGGDEAGDVAGRFDGGGAISSLENLTVTGSTISGNSASSYSGYGGGIYMTRGDLTVSDSTINGNSAGSSGGGILIDRFSGGNLTVIRSTISGNSALRGTGGGIDFNAPYFLTNLRTLSISDSTVTGNSTGAEGGGIWSINAVVTVTGSTISGNSSASGGGGLYHRDEGSLTVTNSTINGNSVGQHGHSPHGGGGIRAGNLTVTNSTISGNSATGGGGGIDMFGRTMKVITNSTISGNSAGRSGGGIYNSYGLTSIRFSTITGNTAPAGGGSGVASYGDYRARTEILSTIVAGNVGSDVDSLYGAVNLFQSNGHNLIGTGNAIGEFVEPGDQTGVADPLLGPLADNGGPTLTHALLPGSPAIDAGDLSAVAGVGTVPLYDQRGNPFARVSGGRIDIGAFESTVMEVAIDIRPGDSTNSINLASKGTVPVAILSSDSLDAALVDPTTLTLAGAAVALHKNGTPRSSLEDVNGDGRPDLLLHFETQALQLTAGDTQAALAGKLFNGQRIRGSDAVRIVGGGQTNAVASALSTRGLSDAPTWPLVVTAPLQVATDLSDATASPTQTTITPTSSASSVAPVQPISAPTELEAVSSQQARDEVFADESLFDVIDDDLLGQLAAAV
jgi:hypothetical protein